MKNILLLSLLLCSIVSFSQEEKKISRKDAKSVKLLVPHIIVGTATKGEKVERIYEWITSSIDYDYSKVNSDKPLENAEVDKVLSTKKAICGEYCNLMQAMLKEINVESIIVNGYVQTPLKDSMVVPISDTHAWIAVKLEGAWYLADPTWDSGYLGNIKTDKEEKYAKKNKKLEKKFIKKSDKLNLKLEKESKASEQKKINKKIELSIEKNIKAKSDLKKEKDNAKVFTGKIGFVSDPKKDWFLIPADSFLLRHLPLNPMWQLKHDTVGINIFSQGRDSIVNRVSESRKANFDYDSEINSYENLDFLERLIMDAEKGNEYSNGNSQVKALNYYNYLSVITSKKVQKVAPPKYKIHDYSSLLHLVDTAKIYTKLAKKESKSNYSYFKKAYVKLHKEDKKKAKIYAKMQTKLMANQEKMIDKIESRNEKLTSKSESIEGKIEKLSHISSKTEFKKDVETVKYLTDSLSALVKVFKNEERKWKIARDSTFLQPLIDTMLYSSYLFRIRNMYIEYQDYELNSDLEVIDSTLIANNKAMNSIYIDSLPIEMVSKELMNGVTSISKFINYSKSELVALESDGKIESADLILKNFNHVLLTQYKSLENIYPEAIDHNVWLMETLSTFENYLDDMDGFIQKQEQAHEERFDYYMNINENDFNRDEKLYKIIEKACAKWKVEFKEAS